MTKTGTPDMNEGPQAFERFRKAVKTVMAVPKDALPPRPNRKTKTQRAKRPR